MQSSRVVRGSIRSWWSLPLMRRTTGTVAKLEVRSAPDRDAQGRTLADVLRERQCRRLAQERNVPYEKVLQEHLAEDRAF
jgi:hypothetical protein